METVSNSTTVRRKLVSGGTGSPCLNERHLFAFSAELMQAHAQGVRLFVENVQATEMRKNHFVPKCDVNSCIAWAVFTLFVIPTTYWLMKANASH